MVIADWTYIQSSSLRATYCKMLVQRHRGDVCCTAAFLFTPLESLLQLLVKVKTCYFALVIFIFKIKLPLFLIELLMGFGPNPMWSYKVYWKRFLLELGKMDECDSEFGLDLRLPSSLPPEAQHISLKSLNHSSSYRLIWELRLHTTLQMCLSPSSFLRRFAIKLNLFL